MIDRTLLEGWVFNDPVSAREFEAWSRDSGLTLPADYLEFMYAHDGGEGWVGDNYLILWKLSELVPFNRDYEVRTYAPGLLPFGSSGGGEAFAYDMRQAVPSIVMVPFVGMSLASVIEVASDMVGLFDALKRDAMYG